MACAINTENAIFLLIFTLLSLFHSQLEIISSSKLQHLQTKFRVVGVVGVTVKLIQ